MTDIRAVVVAAGYGSFRSDERGPVPKVIEEVGGVPMVARSVRAVAAAGFASPIVVVNPDSGERIQEALRMAGCGGCVFAAQEDRRGSCDAVLAALPRITTPAFLAIYADMPFWRSSTIEALRALWETRRATVTMVTVPLNGDASSPLLRYGRVIRDECAQIRKVIEPGDGAPADPRGTVNPSLWVWEREWFLRHAPLVTPQPRPDSHPPEQYLPPLVERAYDGGRPIVEFSLDDPIEALGVNTAEELRAVRRIAAYRR